jgi:hypothetical protein
MSAHRYWRIYIIAATGATHLDISEIQMRTAIAGADQCTGGTAIYSAETVGFEASKAFDDSTATTWYINTASNPFPQYVGYDFGAGNDKDIVEVALTCWQAAEMARDFLIQYSDDASDWVTLYSLRDETGWSPGETRAFSASTDPEGYHRFWRLYCRTTNGAAFAGIAEVEMRASLGGADECTGGTATASTAFPGLEAPGAVDNGAGEWASDGSAMPQWWKYDFGAGVAKGIVELHLTGRNPASQMVTSFDLQWSDDNSTWVNLFTVEDFWNWTAGSTQTFSADNGPHAGAANYQAWRVNITANDGGTVVGIQEVEWRDGEGSDLATGGTAYASSVFDTTTYVPGNAFDNGANVWAAGAATGRLSYKFTGAVIPEVLAIKARSGDPTQAPKNFTIEFWDGSSWQVANTVTNSTGWASDEVRTFDVGILVLSPPLLTNDNTLYAPTVSQPSEAGASSGMSFFLRNEFFY